MLPARPGKPRDKAKVETAVQHVERWVMAPLRHQTFFSLAELRGAIAPLVAALNERPFQKTEGSRLSWFEDLDRPGIAQNRGSAYRNPWSASSECPNGWGGSRSRSTFRLWKGD